MGQMDLGGKVVLVTGSARRVGKAILLKFAEAGANVVVHHGHSTEEAHATAQSARELGVRCVVCQADLRSSDEIKKLFDHVAAEFGRLDVLVNSAASFDAADFLDITLAEWQSVLDINLTAPFLATQHAARLMMAHDGGAIINISDNGGRRPWEKRPHHSVSKAGLIMLTKVSALALGPHNIRVNAIAPGPILPPPDQTEDDWAFYKKKLPLRRIGDPADVAQAAIFLATNTFITGEVLGVDGGSILTVGE